MERDMDSCTVNIADKLGEVTLEDCVIEPTAVLKAGDEEHINDIDEGKTNLVVVEEELKPTNKEFESSSGSHTEALESVPTEKSLPISSTSGEESVPKERETVVQSEDYYLQVLSQYLQCVRSKESHSTFLKDPVTGPFLSLCLASNSDKVLISVLKVINVLLKNRDNNLRLKELLHFTDALLATSRNEDIHVAIRTKAASFYELIKNSKKPLGTNLDSSNTDGVGICLPEPSKPSSNSAKEIRFHVNHTLNKERRFIITRALVRIDGVISVAFNPDLRLCIIRARRVRPETLGVAIANLGFDCSLITKNENSREIIRIPMKPEVTHTEDDNKNHENKKPFYFPEEEDEEEEQGSNAVALKGFGENKDTDGGWWDSAKKLARKSLFW